MSVFSSDHSLPSKTHNSSEKKRKNIISSYSTQSVSNSTNVCVFFVYNYNNWNSFKHVSEIVLYQFDRMFLSMCFMFF